MSVLPNTGIDIPALGGDAGTWDDKNNACWANYDVHNHTPGKGVAIPTAGININADLSFGSLYGPTNLHRLTFASIVALTSNNKSLFVSAADNELYWRSNAGANVKLTSGSALNVAAFTGGIGGDYASVSALVDYDDATDTYRFRQEINTAVRQFAKVQFADIKLTEYDPAGDASVPANTVTIRSPDSLAGSYSLICPTALPGSTSLVQLDSAGQLTASNTLPASLAGTPNFTGAVTMASTLNVTGVTTTGALAPASISSTGLIFGQNGITSAVNTHFTASGTGRYKHGAFELNLAISAYAVDGASTYTTFNQSGYISTFGGACSCQAWIPLAVGKRIVSLQQFYDVAGTGLGIQFFLKRINHATGTVTTVSSSASDNTGTGIESQTLSAINHTMLTGEAYWVQVNVASATHRVYGCTITYDEP